MTTQESNHANGPFTDFEGTSLTLGCDTEESALETFEVDSVLNAMQIRWGYDFHDYARVSIKRRIKATMIQHNLNHMSELVPRILHDPAFFQSMIGNFSIPVTDFFRDPPVFKALVEHVFPILATWPYLKIWHAGCATGEEVYSLAILLQEHQLLDRCTIYATDYNDTVVKAGQAGVYAERSLSGANQRYHDSGGLTSFSHHYIAGEDAISISPKLTKNIVWANHNLVTDGVFGEMHLVLCRNVMIYFAQPLRERVLSLLTNSLLRGGFLCLGDQESIDFSGVAENFDHQYATWRIYQKIADLGTEASQIISNPITPTNS